MTGEEAAALLAAVASVDRMAQRPSAAVATGWAEVLAEVPLAVALHAVGKHYQRTKDPISPADIWAFHRRRQLAEAERRANLPSGFTDRAQAAAAGRRGMGRIRAEMGWENRTR
ncbi:hypothetical protein NLX83_21470 [Allokutzneria sp. A3M-2-11 16]|uniref:hypothetical protein n=1 Tax=Allokutzneria sp. A3M-2-11 16 TaxID=2962043 RepID=UPI0020B8B03A|nr:hypothetical protein [Allokutzneria sp. A3M-2-11 16]MCP3801839.1 hypothetical protein [Allokutzneria sp. A3M-2-11 16]